MSVNKAKIDQLISWYANMTEDMQPGSDWNTQRCFGGVLSMLNSPHSMGGGASVGLIQEQLGVGLDDARRLFCLGDDSHSTSFSGMQYFQECSDPAGWVISILEHLRDTGEVVIKIPA